MSLRDRAEGLLDEVGLEGSGKLATDVKAVAEALGVEFTTIADAVAACERETTSTSTVTPRESLSGNAPNYVTPRESLSGTAPSLSRSPSYGTPRVSLNENAPTAAEALAGAAPMPAPAVFGAPETGPGAAIFWDLAGGSPGSPSAAQELRGLVAALYPGAHTAKAYVDFVALPPQTRVALRTAGVELVDTSSDPNKNEGSHAIVDLFDHALATTAKDQVLVVVLAGSPKGQFGRAFACLARHGYKVALVRPRNSVAIRFDSACFAVHDFGGNVERSFETITLCFKCGWRNCARSHPRRCATMVVCAFCGQTNHDTRYHADFQSYVKGRAAEQAQAQAHAAAAHGLPVPQYGAPRLHALPFQPGGMQGSADPRIPITLQPHQMAPVQMAAPPPAFFPQAAPVAAPSNFLMTGSAFEIGAAPWNPMQSSRDSLDAGPPLLDTNGHVMDRRRGPPSPATWAPPARSPASFSPVCPPPPRSPSPLYHESVRRLGLDGDASQLRPAYEREVSATESVLTLQTDSSESTSDHLR